MKLHFTHFCFLPALSLANKCLPYLNLNNNLFNLNKVDLPEEARETKSVLNTFYRK